MGISPSLHRPLVTPLRGVTQQPRRSAPRGRGRGGSGPVHGGMRNGPGLGGCRPNPRAQSDGGFTTPRSCAPRWSCVARAWLGVPYPRRDAGGPSAGGTLALPGGRRSQAGLPTVGDAVAPARAADGGSRSRTSLGPSAWERREFWPSLELSGSGPNFRCTVGPLGSQTEPRRLRTSSLRIGARLRLSPGLWATGLLASPVAGWVFDTLAVVPPPCREEHPECCAESYPS